MLLKACSEQVLNDPATYICPASLYICVCLNPLCFMQAFKQKIKHLLYEHGHHIEQLKADADAAVKVAAEEFHVRESLLLADKRALQTQLRELVSLGRSTF